MHWLVVGASRGIGRDFVSQLRDPSGGHAIYATARDVPVLRDSLELEERERPGAQPVSILQLDVTSESSINVRLGGAREACSR